MNCLKNQIHKNFEVILVDGNSQDKTRTLVSGYKSWFPLTIVRLQKGNLSLQKNTGGQRARASTLIFFDADMYVKNNFTRRAEIEIKKRKGLVYIPHVYPIEKKDYPEVHAVMNLFNQLVGLSLNTHIPFSAGPPQIWNKEVFLHIGGFDDIFGEDHHIIRKAQDWGVRPVHMSKLKVWFSLRRLKKQGRIKLFSHFIRTHIHLLFNDTVPKGFEYKMGGQLYKAKREELTRQFSIRDLHTVLANVQSFLKKLVRED
jgi:glycosyltransferase involved in cell wall biosynthesis